MRCGDPTWMAQNFGFLEMSNFDIYVMHSVLLEQFWETQNLGHSMLGHHTSWLSLATLLSSIPTMNFVHLQTILSQRYSGKRKFSHNKGFPTVIMYLQYLHILIKINVLNIHYTFGLIWKHSALHYFRGIYLFFIGKLTPLAGGLL